MEAGTIEIENKIRSRKILREENTLDILAKTRR
jgi:hypothetical protein